MNVAWGNGSKIIIGIADGVAVFCFKNFRHTGMAQ